MIVGHRGFIETPRKWTEFYAGHPAHRWLVDDCRGILSFEPITFNASPFMNFALSPFWSSRDLQRRAKIDYPDIPCVHFSWSNKLNYKVYSQKNDISLYESRAAIAGRHYSFARNLLYWMAPHSQGLYHAARAVELSPDNPVYLELYAFYLALCGKLTIARQWGLSPKLFCYAVICFVVFHASRLASFLYRRITSLFPLR